MNKFITKIVGAALGLTLAIGVGVAVGAKHDNSIPVRADGTDYISFNMSNFDGIGGSYDSGNEKTGSVTSNGGTEYGLGARYTMSSSGWQWQASNGVAYNTDAFPGRITNISVTQSTTRAFTVRGGTSALTGPSDGTQIGSSKSTASMSWDTDANTNYTYFIICRGSNAAKVTNITVTFETGPSKTLESVTIINDMSKKAYYVGDSWDYSGLSLQGNYDDDSTGVIGTVPNLISQDKLAFTATPAAPTLNTTQLVISDIIYGDELVEGTGNKTITGITVTNAPVISAVSLEGDMDTKEYSLNDNWDYSGLYLDISWTEGKENTTIDLSDLTEGDDFLSDPESANSLDITGLYISGSYEGFDFEKTITGISVAIEPVLVTISGAGNSGTTRWKPTATGASSSFTDSLGKTIAFTTDVPSAGFTGNGTPYQIGTNSNSGTYVLFTVSLTDEYGIAAAGVKYASSGGTNTAECLVYGDTENDIILSNSVTGTTASEFATGNEYQVINATTLHFKFTFPVGCKVGYLSYTLGATVQSFQTFTSLEILTPSGNTQFKVGDTFSAPGLVLRATDNVGFTKDFVTGFKLGTSQGDNSFVGRVFNAADAVTGTFTVYVTLTIDEITKSVTYQITVTEVPNYTLVTDYSSLYEGARVLIVSGTNAAGEFGTKYLTAGNVTFTNDVITSTSDVVEFVVRLYGDKFVFQIGAYYLSYPDGSDTNSITKVATIDEGCAFTATQNGLQSPVSSRYLAFGSTLSPVGFACLTDGSNAQLYISNKSVYDDDAKANSFIYRYLHMRDYLGVEGEDGSNYCKDNGDGAGKNYFADATTAYNALTAEVKAEFKKNTEAVKRLKAWATANGFTFDENAGTITQNSRNIVMNSANKSDTTILVIVLVSSISLVAVSSYFVIRRRREN